uniref:Uncharacterized protein n=1 Tax=Stomoxys calcitrans TaxID=35570 RepID=A0A1I8PWS0_STOCA
MADRFQISKVNGGDFEPTNITTICENSSDPNSNNNNGASSPPPQTTPHYQQHPAPRKSSRISFRGFGSIFSKDKEDRKYSLGQLTQDSAPRLDFYRLSMRNQKRPSIGELQCEPIEEHEVSSHCPRFVKHN